VKLCQAIVFVVDTVEMVVEVVKETAKAAAEVLEKGVAQSGIPRLCVFQGSKLVYDISTKAENSAPTSK
jgi:hypothetical protein